MSKLFYICKYTPIELLAAYGADLQNLNSMPSGFDRAEQIAHPNLCGFGKAILEEVLSGTVKELVLVNCCDTIRCVYDILADSGKLDFLYMMDMLRCDSNCGREKLMDEIMALASAYERYSGADFDEELFRKAFQPKQTTGRPYISVMGARMGDELYQLTQAAMPYPVRNDTCVNNRTVGNAIPPETTAFEELMDWYSAELMAQLPCMRMSDHTGRKKLLNDENLKGIVYHTVKFCDFYSFEYAALREQTKLPLLKIESDYTLQSSGQLSTRLNAFSESIRPRLFERKNVGMNKGYCVGIDSGSTSTDVVILDRDLKIISSVILPTGAGATTGAQRALEEALTKAHLHRDEIAAIVTTGYGRDAITDGDQSITEITCHARGAHFLDPTVRTVIDIGGQDSKAIRLDANGTVINFAMNDKCAAGTGRFLEMMARVLELSMDEMSERGISFKEDITISSMCSVFAESEVISLIAQNKRIDDIVYGLNKSVAVKISALVKRIGGEDNYMMTGGVSKNAGLVQALEQQLGAKIAIHENAQLCGAIGAALFAADMIQNTTIQEEKP